MLFYNTLRINQPITGSLQAQTSVISSPKRKRASRLASCKGSATVEAAMILPIFLCAIAALIMMGQMLLVEGEVEHTTVKTAALVAGQESVKELYRGSASMAGDFLEPTAVFYSIFQAGDLCDSCIVGGKHGILLSMSHLPEENRIRVTARYSMRIPLPFFGRLCTLREIRAEKTLYTGYHLHGREEKTDDRIVYLAENGTVYHTSMSCSHISLRIKGSSLTRTMLNGRGIRACEKCIHSGQIPSSFYITAEGDCYHSSLSCSGLKRTVKAVRLSEVKGMRLCGRCAKKT